IDRVQALWRELRGAAAGQGDYLFGDFGIADAMFAPVCVRFRGYGVPMDAAVQAYVDAIYALPAMREWVAAALAETERVGADEA
ncbi:MAG: glutathione S-transferase C-terminal domain-containing protein, partial [Arenimonas sp.]|nr:glutathione S-transferase C-terminal domain-containing protein [Arenimonas sp.]